jgi:hypothetical protein
MLISIEIQKYMTPHLWLIPRELQTLHITVDVQNQVAKRITLDVHFSSYMLAPGINDSSDDNYRFLAVDLLAGDWLAGLSEGGRKRPSEHRSISAVHSAENGITHWSKYWS